MWMMRTSFDSRSIALLNQVDLLSLNEPVVTDVEEYGDYYDSHKRCYKQEQIIYGRWLFQRSFFFQML